jgi:hypothetical protein
MLAMAKDKTTPAGTSPAFPDVPPHPRLPDDHPEKQRVEEFRAQQSRTLGTIMQWWEPDAKKIAEVAEAEAVHREDKSRGGLSGRARMKLASDEDALKLAVALRGRQRSTYHITVTLAEKFPIRVGAWKRFIRRAEAEGKLPKRLGS